MYARRGLKHTPAPGALWFAEFQAHALADAIKILSPSKDSENIGTEIELLRECDSSHVVAYHGAFHHRRDHCLWIVMECCEGSVLDVMEATGLCLTERQLSAVVAAALDGLYFLHRRQIMHRDVKCGNILLTRAGGVKLSDFGVATRLSSTLSARHTLVGTARWMAPEVCCTIAPHLAQRVMGSAGTGYNKKADIWSLGIAAIEMGEGAPPLGEATAFSALFFIPNNPPPTLSEPGRWSPAFAKFLARALVKAPAERATADELLLDPFISEYGRGAQQAHEVQRLVDAAATPLEEVRAARRPLDPRIQRVASVLLALGGEGEGGVGGGGVGGGSGVGCGSGGGGAVGGSGANSGAWAPSDLGGTIVINDGSAGHLPGVMQAVGSAITAGPVGVGGSVSRDGSGRPRASPPACAPEHAWACTPACAPAYAPAVAAINPSALALGGAGGGVEAGCATGGPLTRARAVGCPATRHGAAGAPASSLDDDDWSEDLEGLSSSSEGHPVEEEAPTDVAASIAAATSTPRPRAHRAARARGGVAFDGAIALLDQVASVPASSSAGQASSGTLIVREGTAASAEGSSRTQQLLALPAGLRSLLHRLTYAPRGASATAAGGAIADTATSADGESSSRRASGGGGRAAARNQRARVRPLRARSPASARQSIESELATLERQRLRELQEVQRRFSRREEVLRLEALRHGVPATSGHAGVSDS